MTSDGIIDQLVIKLGDFRCFLDNTTLRNLRQITGLREVDRLHVLWNFMPVHFERAHSSWDCQGNLHFLILCEVFKVFNQYRIYSSVKETRHEEDDVKPAFNVFILLTWHNEVLSIHSILMRRRYPSIACLCVLWGVASSSSFGRLRFFIRRICRRMRLSYEMGKGDLVL